jgi:DNA-binding protein H-NS
VGSIKRRPYLPAKWKVAGDLDQLAIEELVALREQAEAILLQRVAAEKEAVKAKLAQLESVAKSISGSGKSGTPAPQKRAKPTPKYRNPVTGETWAGRGLKPRWMVQAINAGRAAEEFLIHKPHLVHSAG